MLPRELSRVQLLKAQAKGMPLSGYFQSTNFVASTRRDGSRSLSTRKDLHVKRILRKPQDLVFWRESTSFPSSGYSEIQLYWADNILLVLAKSRRMAPI